MKGKTAKMQTRQLLKGVLVAALAIVIAAGAPARATTIVATGVPATDFTNIQNALDGGGEVVLQNGPDGEIFDLTGIEDSLKITCDVILRGQDDAAGKAKIIANNFRLVEGGMWEYETIAIEVDNPGGTVEFVNLDIESDVRSILHVGRGGDIWSGVARDACKDLKIKNCKIVGTHEIASCVGTQGCLMGTFYLEGNHIAGHWCAGDYAYLTGLVSSSKWEVHSNSFVATAGCVDIVTSKGIRMENNQCEGPVILNSTVMQGEIVVKNNTMIQSGHFVLGESNNALGLMASHWAGFSGGEISGNTIEMNPSEDVQLSFVPAICLADYVYFGGAHGLLIQDNTIAGKADWAISLDMGASDNTIRRNNLENFTATQFGYYGACQISLTDWCQGNLLTDNVIGPLGPGAGVGIYCAGDNNDFVKNDYTQSGIPGIKNGEVPCLYLTEASQENFVHESGGFPPGTGGAKYQVVNLSFDEDGNTTNTVIGHRANTR